jgi:hypothetical protein
VVATVVLCEGTEALWEPVLHRPPAPWEITVVVAMWLMGNMMILSNVDRPAVIPAVVWVVAQRLHADLSASFHHDVGVRTSSLVGVHDLEGVSASSGTVL